MRGAAAIAMLLCFWLPERAAAHDLRHSIEEGVAVTVKLFFADGNEFSFESYEVYHAGEEIPFQVGRTDALGRLVFRPDRAGTWRVKVFSEDGHGADLSLTTGVQGAVESADRSLFERHSRLVVGVSIIFGIFGLVSLYARRKDSK
jgi:nickel transport protein